MNVIPIKKKGRLKYLLNPLTHEKTIPRNINKKAKKAAL